MPSTVRQPNEPSQPTEQGLSANWLVLAIQRGEVLPGDAIVYRYATPSLFQRLIARVQRRALADSGGMVDSWTVGTEDQPSGNPAIHQSASGFTHAGMVLDIDRSVEMTSPHARAVGWTERLRGVAEAVVLRPVRATDPGALRRAANAGLADAWHEIPYPHRELVLYWLWSWGWRKLGRGQAFDRVFRSRQRNVCSGSVVSWWRSGGVDVGLFGLDAWPEGWYPARFLADARFRSVAHATASPSLAGDRSNHKPHAQDRLPAGGRRQPSHLGSALSGESLLPCRRVPRNRLALLPSYAPSAGASPPGMDRWIDGMVDCRRAAPSANTHRATRRSPLHPPMNHQSEMTNLK